jgi:hypothetical protein
METQTGPGYEDDLTCLTNSDDYGEPKFHIPLPSIKNQIPTNVLDPTGMVESADRRSPVLATTPHQRNAALRYIKKHSIAHFDTLNVAHHRSR